MGGASAPRDIEVRITPDPEAAAAEAAAILAACAAAAGSIVLAGGSTPRRAYELAAAAEGDWGDAEVWFGDDRCVPPNDPRSNQLLVRDALLDRLLVPPIVRAIETTQPADAAAAAYDAALRDVLLDLVLLGLGSDGHTASLFPDAPSLDVVDRLAVAAAPALDPFVERVTLTIPALTAAPHVVFLAVGADKADAARRAFGEPPSRSTPASLVRSLQGRTTVILDTAAASELAVAGR